MSAFWDSSALVPVCITQTGSDSAAILLETSVPIVWWSTPVEIASAIARGVRSVSVPDPPRLAALERLVTLRASWIEIQPSNRIRELAAEQLQRFGLRAADALQLGAALVWCSERPRGRRFICNDRKLSDAARQLGFDVVSFY